ncbi:MAG: undecaprenyldiphospho-muramoylpentapeptide beta-N-acetylglucosaminyltransferase [Prolixibacteraceae bacterium]|jgi:UDP-N-acetylglucosamine--N-acetylmuramyl-(pentapeptide) pyrophosphoryl-undecaprenol N-acetylglucosamine transferase|nr:undecaprenyldiphospho-muramoylpentapeptide beta-N-acetylglucosaminyltransferase [Prolixibacteraceae bacterium]
MTKNLKIIISGGGTGGHIFPALSIANEIKEMLPDTEFLFVGALGRMEMERVPAAGYNIVGLPIMGFPRKPGVKMLTFFINLARSMRSARRVVKQMQPDVVVGVGGYASGPILKVAAKLKFPSLIQEQNSYAGLTNRLLAKRVDKICVAYNKMENYFPQAKIVYTGNPVRKNLIEAKDNRNEAIDFFKLDKQKKVILIVGGSLGARTLNNSLLENLDLLRISNVEIIWQTGKYYYESIIEKTKDLDLPNVHIHEFLSRMDLAYAAADLVISRAGAGTISELCLMGKATILVPSPNVAEDHQTKNAMALVEQKAAIMIPDGESIEKLVSVALELVDEDDRIEHLHKNILKLAKPNAAKEIAEMVIELATKK